MRRRGDWANLQVQRSNGGSEGVELGDQSPGSRDKGSVESLNPVNSDVGVRAGAVLPVARFQCNLQVTVGSG